MTPFTKRGLPPSLARDAWWFCSAPDATGRPRRQASSKVHAIAPCVLAFVVLVDWAFWTAPGGVILALFLFGVAGILAAALRPDRATLRDMVVICGVSSLPVLSFVQALSILIWLVGLCVLVARAAQWPLGRTAGLWLRLPWAGVSQLMADLQTVWGASNPRSHGIVRDWAMAVALSLGFVMLFALANPIIETTLQSAWGRFVVFDVDWPRPLLWLWAAIFIVLVVSAVYIKVPAQRPPRAPRRALPGVRNALLVFNVIFLFQLATDAWVFGLASNLPDGMTYASYAHRGAYPLIVTALLAGGFMLVAREPAHEDRMMRWLLTAWVVQNMLLLTAAAFRLGLYVDVYGWTYLRLHCFIWMGVVAIGLGLLAFDLWRPKGVRWIIRSCAVVAAGTLYLACFVNFAEGITHANLERAKDGKRTDWYYIANLGPSNDALLSETLVSGQGGTLLYQSSNPFNPPVLVQRWRDWDIRRWRRDQRIARLSASQQATP